MDALVLKDVCKRYNDFSLDKVSFSVPMGSIMGFIGENGAGKSTTINLILDLIRRDSGEIEVLGERSRHLSAAARSRLGVVLDEAGFAECMSARQVGRMMGMTFSTWQPAVFEQYLQRFRLPPQKAVKEYSRGMKMKLGLAAAMSHEAKLLILDEATSGLDPVVRDEITDILFEYIQDERHAVLMSSHITSDLEKVCDYVTFIRAGKVLYSEEKDLLLSRMGMLHGTRAQLERLEQSAVHGVRRGEFGIEALVERKKVPAGWAVEPATLDDIIVFTAREGKPA